MEDYKPNSHTYKEKQKETPEEKPRVEKVTTGVGRVKKKNELSKMAGALISEEAHNVKNYILMDVLLPAIKDAIEDIVTNGIRMILRGETTARKSGSGASKISYRDYYGKKDEDRRYSSTQTRSGYGYNDVTVDTRGEAEEVLMRMDELIETYGVVRVADLYDLVGITGEYTDNKYGWTNVRNAEVIRVREGYLIRMPKALPLH